MKYRDIYGRRYKIQETLYVEQWCLSPLQSRHLGTLPSSPNCHQLLPEPHRQSEISSLSKVILVLGKARSHRAPNLGHSGADLSDLMFCQKNCMRRDARAGALSWGSCQSPVAHSCGLLNHLNSFHRGMLKLNTKFDADSLLYSLSHFECSGHTVHMLTQRHLPSWLTGTARSSLFIHAHSSPLSLATRLHRCRSSKPFLLY